MRKGMSRLVREGPSIILDRSVLLALQLENVAKIVESGRMLRVELDRLTIGIRRSDQIAFELVLVAARVKHVPLGRFAALPPGDGRSRCSSVRPRARLDRRAVAGSRLVFLNSGRGARARAPAANFRGTAVRGRPAGSLRPAWLWGSAEAGAGRSAAEVGCAAIGAESGRCPGMAGHAGVCPSDQAGSPGARCRSVGRRHGRRERGRIRQPPRRRPEASAPGSARGPASSDGRRQRRPIAHASSPDRLSAKVCRPERQPAVSPAAMHPTARQAVDRREARPERPAGGAGRQSGSRLVPRRRSPDDERARPPRQGSSASATLEAWQRGRPGRSPASARNATLIATCSRRDRQGVSGLRIWRRLLASPG